MNEVKVDKENYKITGDDADNRFVVRFSGAAGLAERHAENAMRALRDPRGKYKDISAPKPGGGDARIYINPDRNPRMQKIMRESKRLGVIFRETHPDHRWHVNRNDGEISKG